MVLLYYVLGAILKYGRSKEWGALFDLWSSQNTYVAKYWTLLVVSKAGHDLNA